MADTSTLGSAMGNLLATQADTVIRQAGTGAAATKGSTARENTRIEKSAKDFESILLSNWLQGAEESFAKVPGADDDEDADAGKDSFQGIAMQSLGSSMTAAGGIGIAKMIAKQLHKADDVKAPAAGAPPASAPPAASREAAAGPTAAGKGAAWIKAPETLLVPGPRVPHRSGD